MAGAVVSALAGVLGGGVVATTIATALVRLVVATVLSYAQQALLGEDAQKPDPIAQQNRTNGTIAPQRILLGRTRTVGHDMFPPYCHDVLGSAARSINSGPYLTLGIALSDVSVTGLHSVIVQDLEFVVGTHLVDNGNSAGLEIATGLAEEYERYRGNLWIKFYDGTQTVADPFMRTVFAGHPDRPYTADMVYAGGAYALLTAKSDQELWTDLQKVYWIVDGIRIGGSFTTNPITLANAIASGITLPSGDVFGPQMPFDPNWLNPAVAACDAAGFTAGLEVQIGAPDGNGVNGLDAMEDLLEACAGRAWDDGGTLKVTALDGGLPIAHITDDTILLSRGQMAEKAGALKDRINSITISHPNAQELWEIKPAPTFTDQAAVVVDGERLPAALTFPAVSSSDQGQTLAGMLVADAQRIRVHSFALPVRYGDMTVQDKLTWTSARYGYDTKTFRIEAITRAPSHTLVTVREVNPSDFDPDAVTLSPYTPTVVTPTGPGELTIDAAFTASTLTDDGGDLVAGVTVALGAVPTAADAVRWEIRVEGQTATISGTFDPNQLSVFVPLSSAVAYEGRARFVAPTRTAPWGDWVAFITGNVQIEPGALAPQVWTDIAASATAITTGLLDEFQGDVIDPINAAFPPINDQIGGLDERVEGLAIGQRSSVQAADDMSENVLRSLLMVQSTQSLVRDAGVYVSPDQGKVRIAGLEQIEGQVSEVSIEVEAQKAAIKLFATFAEVEGLIAEAAFDPSSFADFTDLQLRMTTVEAGIDALNGALSLKSDTITVNGIDARLATAEVEINSLNQTIQLKLDTTEFTAVETRLGTVEVTLSTIDGPALTQSVADTRQLQEAVDTSGLANLQGLLELYRTREAMRTDLAFAQEDMRALVNEDRVAIAELTQTLGVAIDQNAALITAESATRADADSALASSVETLEAQAASQGDDISGNATAIGGLTTRVETSEGTLVTQGQQLAQLSATVGTAEGEIASNANAISGLSARVTTAEDSLTSQSQDLTNLDARIDGVEDDADGNATAIQQIDARVTQNADGLDTQSQQLTALGSQIAAAEAEVAGNAGAIGGLTTRVTNTEGVVAAQATQVTNLTTTVGENTAAITQQGQSIDGLQLEYTIQLDNNGHVSGLVLRSDLDDANAVVASAAFVADRFAIVGVGDDPVSPFVTYTTPTTINGVTIPAGVYMENANIRDLSATVATIGRLESAATGGRVIIEDDLIQVIDDNEVVRVKIGRLT